MPSPLRRANKIFSDLVTYAPALTAAYAKGLRLKIVSDKTGKIAPSDIILVCCQRNEVSRLPFFFDYYRGLGVSHFLFVDNDSDDGSLAWLSEQSDCSVWHTKASYRDAKFGMDWCNDLLRRYGANRWCLTVDADEFLVFPKMETRSLRGLCQYLDDESRRSFQVVMLDAYSDRPLNETLYEAGDDPFTTCPFFDLDGYVQDDGFGKATWIRGGPRLRAHFHDAPASSPGLNKTPLIKWRMHYHYRSSMHDCRPYYLNDAQRNDSMPVTGCLFHFKFMNSLLEKTAEERVRKQHYLEGAEYDRYGVSGNVLLYRDGLSVRYEGTEQLMKLGLMSQGRWF
jgi:hypothetical protein